MRRWLTLVGLCGLVLALGAACNNKSSTDTKSTATITVKEQEAASTPRPLEPTTTAPPPEPTNTPAPSVTYNIAQRQDVSFGTTVRIVYRVGVSGSLTDRELRRIAKEIIDDETGRQDVSAIRFFFYLPGTDTTNGYTAGTAVWAPNGDWASADTVQAGHYSKHQLGDIALSGPE
jgi:hypothetical protein